MSCAVTTKPSAAAKEASPSWEELLGSKNWEGLIEPELNLKLREFILRCGDFCQATYDAFNSVPESPNCGNSNYGKPSFFCNVLLKEASRYQVISFLYATAGVATEKSTFLVHPRAPSPWAEECNWFGFVAVAVDKASHGLGRREVYVAWRGTIMTEEWLSNIVGARPVSVKPLLAAYRRGREEPKVHDGWLNIYTSENSLSDYVKSSARAQLHAAMEAIKRRYKDEKLSVIVTGHSLGGALATLSGFDLAENDVAGGGVTVVGFGCPQVGNEAFKERVKTLPGLKILNVTNIRDMVPKTPDTLLSVYVPIATAEVEIDTRKSPYLVSKSAVDVFGDFHNLQANLHVVAGWNGSGEPFEMRVKRSLALVNKSSRFLAAELKIPEFWWIERNKGMHYCADSDDWLFDPPPPADQMVTLSFT